ncbi:MFS transporter [Parafrankia discariae]|uniref:MFS transporter n=1 Tax=Parafrankia discariae TaxID=365528 RepID=UPI0003A2F249|nr:MFS transporter [Parafrankia discariae]
MARVRTDPAEPGVGPEPARPAVPTPPRPGLLIATLAVAGIVASFMHTLVVPIIPQLPRLLDSSASNTTWVVTITLLAGAVATPVAGRLGDMYGKRRIMLASVGLLGAGSLVCALSTSLPQMVVGRGLQGLATGLIPLGISLMRDELPPERLGSALGLMSSSLGIGGALGVPTSALIAQNFNWHVLFWTATVLSVLVLALLWRVVPESPVRDVRGRFDVVGALGLGAGITCLLLAVSKGSAWGWTSTATLGTVLAALAVLALWGPWELRHPSPVVDLRVSARRQVLMTNLTSVVVGFAMYGMGLVIPQFLQLPAGTGYGLGKSMVVAGLCFAPFGVVMMLASPLTARVSARWGPKTTLVLGSAIIGVSYLIGLFLMHSVWQVVLLAVIGGVGVALAYASMPSLIMDAVPATETAAANGLNTLMRSLGTSSSAAVVGVMLANMTSTFDGRQVPSLAGFHAVFALGAGAAVAAVLIGLFIPGRGARRTPAPAGTAPREPGRPRAQLQRS